MKVEESRPEILKSILDNIKDNITRDGGVAEKERIDALLCSLKGREKELKAIHDRIAANQSEPTTVVSEEGATAANAEDAAKPNLKLLLSNLFLELAKRSDGRCRTQAFSDEAAAGTEPTPSAEEQAQFAPVVEVALVGHSASAADEVG
jgi:hypothetical protein